MTGHDLPPARIVYVTVEEGRDSVIGDLTASWPSLSVEVVASIDAAVSAVDFDVDAVLAHQQLADGTGLDLQRRLNPTDRTVPVVLLVDETTPEVAAAAVATDLAGYVPTTDGVDVERIADVIEDCIDHDSRSETAAEDLSSPGDQNPIAWKASLLDQLFARLPVHLFVKDREARHVLMSEGLVDDPEPYLGARDTEVDLVPESEGRAGVADDFSVIETGAPIIDKEEYYPSIDRWFLTSKVPTYDADGEITGLMGASREITERKRAEEKLTRSNERLDRFASVVSHDLRNPLAIASARLELAREACEHPDSAADEHLAAIGEALERMETLVDELLTLAQQGVAGGDHEPLSLSTVSEECWARISERPALTVADSFTFMADPTRAQQLFENLFRNSVEHGSTGSRAQSDDAVEHCGEGVSVRVGVLEDETGFYVEDDGPGIPSDVAADAFEPGFTTAEDGTGFGLSIVREVAHDHGWAVRVTDAESGGARFEVTGVETTS